MVKVSIVVLNWNGKHLLEGCLPSILAQTYHDLEIIVVDNASDDGSQAFVRLSHPKVHLVENEKNLGFAAGNNEGIRVAKGEWILILNNDTRLEKDCITELLRVVEGKDHVGMAAPKMLLPDGAIDTLGLKIFPSGLTEDIKSGDHPLCPCGGAAFYRKAMLEDIKLGKDYFDSDYFIYYEDLDLGLRARLRKWGCVSAQKAIVHHHHGATMGHSEKSISLGIRNRIWTVWKDFPTAARVLYYPLFAGLQLAVLVKYIRQKKGKLAWKAMRDAWDNRFRMREKRRLIQRHRKITSAEFRKLLS